MSIFIAATLTGRVSGGHFNGAVTFGVYIVEGHKTGRWRQNIRLALTIVIVDLLGSFAAMILSIWLLKVDGIFTLIPPESKKNWESLFFLMGAEAYFTCILVSTVLFVKYRSVASTSDGMLSNLTVALGIWVCVKMAGSITGAALNPSFATAIIVVDSIVNALIGNEVEFVFLISYIIGPLLGGAIAALLLIFTLKVTPKDNEEGEGPEVYDDNDETFSFNKDEEHTDMMKVNLNPDDHVIQRS